MLRESVSTNEKLALLLGDIGVYAFRNEIAEYPERVLNVGIMEQAMVGFGAGMAAQGFHPVFHSIAPFLLERCYEQIKVDFGYQRLPGTFVSVGAPYQYSKLGATHHSPADLAMMLSIPRMNVWSPASDLQAEEVLRHCTSGNELNYVRLGPSSVSKVLSPIKDGMARVSRGEGPAILAVGSALPKVQNALGHSQTNLFHVWSLRPFPLGLLQEQLSLGSRLLIVEDAYEGTTLFAEPELASLFDIRAKGIPKRFIETFGSVKDLDAEAGLSTTDIAIWLADNGVELNHA